MVPDEVGWYPDQQESLIRYKLFLFILNLCSFNVLTELYYIS